MQLSCSCLNKLVKVSEPTKYDEKMMEDDFQDECATALKVEWNKGILN